MRRLHPLVAAHLAALAWSAAPAQAAAPSVPCVDGVVVPVRCSGPHRPASAPAAQACEGSAAIPTTRNAAAVRAATLCLLNRERLTRGLRPLRSNPALRAVATRYARQMVRHRFFAHVSPSGSTLERRVRASSYLRGRMRSWSLGENIAWGRASRATAAQTVEAWMRSPGHRRNVLDRRFREAGIGVALGSPVGGGGATQANVFGRRSR